MSLIERADSVLIVIDAQPGFSGASGEEAAAAALSREVAGWLTGVAAALGVPVVVTEEDADRNGPTDAADPGSAARRHAGHAQGRVRARGGP